MDSSLLSNIQKLFYERIEVFATVEFYKLSIVTGIIKIVLKVILHVYSLNTKQTHTPELFNKWEHQRNQLLNQVYYITYRLC